MIALDLRINQYLHQRAITIISSFRYCLPLSDHVEEAY